MSVPIGAGAAAHAYGAIPRPAKCAVWRSLYSTEVGREEDAHGGDGIMRRLWILLYELPATVAIIAGLFSVLFALTGWREWQEHGPSPWWLLIGGIFACTVGIVLFRISPRGRNR
jgi:hypothetical protein